MTGIALSAGAMAIGVRALTRRGHDWTYRVPQITEAIQSVPVRSATIDGEYAGLTASRASTASERRSPGARRTHSCRRSTSWNWTVATCCRRPWERSPGGLSLLDVPHKRAGSSELIKHHSPCGAPVAQQLAPLQRFPRSHLATLIWPAISRSPHLAVLSPHQRIVRAHRPSRQHSL